MSGRHVKEVPTVFDGKQKAVAAFIVTLLATASTSLLTALQAVGDGATVGDLDTAAWLTIIVSVLASTGLTTGAVYSVTNRGEPEGYLGD